MSVLADFFQAQFDRKKLSPSSIEGYRSAINSVWSLDGRKVQDSYAMVSLLKSFKAERPRSVHTYPKWDLALVLRVLRAAPFEPIDTIDPLLLSQKTAFLLLLASARRVGDIHAVDPNNIVFQPRKQELILTPVAGYLPKVAATAEGQPRYKSIVIRSLSKITNDPAELTICPVRALLAYDKYAKAKRPNRKRFWIATRSNGNDVCKQTVSGWVSALIKYVSVKSTDEDCRLSSASTHEVRAIATSLSYNATFALEHVLAAATWAQPTTFIDYYLRDVSGLRGQLHVLGPCIAAGYVLH